MSSRSGSDVVAQGSSFFWYYVSSLYENASRGGPLPSGHLRLFLTQLFDSFFPLLADADSVPSPDVVLPCLGLRVRTGGQDPSGPQALVMSGRGWWRSSARCWWAEPIAGVETARRPLMQTFNGPLSRRPTKKCSAAPHASAKVPLGKRRCIGRKPPASTGKTKRRKSNAGP